MLFFLKVNSFYRSIHKFAITIDIMRCVAKCQTILASYKKRIFTLLSTHSYCNRLYRKDRVYKKLQLSEQRTMTTTLELSLF